MTEEIVEVAAAAGTTLTVTRGVDGTSAATHAAAAAVRHAVSARDFREPQEHIAATAAHGVSGNVVGTTDEQAMTNKDMTDESNTFPPSITLPAGMVAPYAGGSAPTGWLLADGSAVSRSTYADLFAAIGTSYGAGDGSTTFNLPNLKGKLPVGRDAAQSEFDTLGETGGEKTHVLTTAELPSHAHSINHDHGAVSTGGQSASHTHTGGTDTQGAHSHSALATPRSIYAAGGSSAGMYALDYNTPTNTSGAHAHNVTTNAASNDHSHVVDLPNFTGSSGNIGSGSAHNNLQPYVVMNYIIKH